jgi:hypothetical protein
MGFSVDLTDVPLFQEAFTIREERAARKACVNMLVKMLIAKFGEGSVPTATEESLNDLTLEALVRIGQKLVNSSSVAETLGDHMPQGNSRGETR